MDLLYSMGIPVVRSMIPIVRVKKHSVRTVRLHGLQGHGNIHQQKTFGE
jgi:hypothetical protein